MPFYWVHYKFMIESMPGWKTILFLAISWPLTFNNLLLHATEAIGAVWLLLLLLSSLIIFSDVDLGVEVDIILIRGGKIVIKFFRS